MWCLVNLFKLRKWIVRLGWRAMMKHGWRHMHLIQPLFCLVRNRNPAGMKVLDWNEDHTDIQQWEKRSSQYIWTFRRQLGSSLLSRPFILTLCCQMSPETDYKTIWASSNNQIPGGTDCAYKCVWVIHLFTSVTVCITICVRVSQR